MKIVIFCGGKGTRIREETENRPKPMIEIGGRPIVWHIMKLYAHYGFTDFILCLGYKQEVIKDYFMRYAHMNSNFTINLNQQGLYYHDNHPENWNVTLVDTGLETKKGGRLKLVAPHITTDKFMLTYGDGVADINIKSLVDLPESIIQETLVDAFRELNSSNSRQRKKDTVLEEADIENFSLKINGVFRTFTVVSPPAKIIPEEI